MPTTSFEPKFMKMGVLTAALQELTPTDGAKVTARFADGKPALVENRFKAGNGYLFAFFPGCAFMQSGIPRRAFDRGERSAAVERALDTARSHQEGLVGTNREHGLGDARTSVVHSSLVDSPRL